MGTGCFASRQSYNCSYQVYILIKEKKSHSSQILPEDSSLQLPFENVSHGSLKLFQCPRPGCLHEDDTGMTRVWVCADAAALLQKHRLCTAEREALCFKEYLKNPKPGKLCCQRAPRTQLLPLCKYSSRKKSGSTHKMEQALEPEDVLSQLLSGSRARPLQQAHRY